MKQIRFWMFAAIFFCGALGMQAQVMKTADLEKYAKQRYGDKWLDAAANLSRTITLDKNQSLTYQEVVEAPGKTKQQLYVAMNYWATATFKDKQAITLNDKEAGCIIISSTIQNIVEHTGTINSYSVSITPIIRIDIKDGRIRVTYTVQNYDILADISGGWLTLAADSDRRTYGDSKRKKDDKTNANLYDEQWEIARHYPFVEKDAQKRTCAKALVMTHAYSNAVIDKIEEAVTTGKKNLSSQRGRPLNRYTTNGCNCHQQALQPFAFIGCKCVSVVGYIYPIQRSMSLRLATTIRRIRMPKPTYSALIMKFSEGFLRVIIS